MTACPILVLLCLAAGRPVHDVAIIVPAASRGDAESRSARVAAEEMGELLGEIGLEADMLEDAALDDAALARRRVAILPDNPGLSDQAAAALEKFIDAGGKVVVCYQLPPRLEKVLGFGKARHVTPKRPQTSSPRCDSMPRTSPPFRPRSARPRGTSPPSSRSANRPG